jgi:hypothetical protein
VRDEQIRENTLAMLLEGMANPKAVLERLEVKKKFYEEKIKDSKCDIWHKALHEVKIEIETVENFINDSV